MAPQIAVLILHFFNCLTATTHYSWDPYGIDKNQLQRDGITGNHLTLTNAAIETKSNQTNVTVELHPVTPSKRKRPSATVQEPTQAPALIPRKVRFAPIPRQDPASDLLSAIPRGINNFNFV